MVDFDGIGNIKTFHEWEELDDKTKNFLTFQAIISIDKFIQDWQKMKWRRTLGQMTSAFVGGVVFWVAVVTFWRGLIPPVVCK